MVYDNTNPQIRIEHNGDRGYAIHENKEDGDTPTFDIYEDDGRGNGDHLCSTASVYWARVIAHTLDQYFAHSDYDYNGNPR